MSIRTPLFFFFFFFFVHVAEAEVRLLVGTMFSHRMLYSAFICLRSGCNLLLAILWAVAVSLSESNRGGSVD